MHRMPPAYLLPHRFPPSVRSYPALRCPQRAQPFRPLHLHRKTAETGCRMLYWKAFLLTGLPTGYSSQNKSGRLPNIFPGFLWSHRPLPQPVKLPSAAPASQKKVPPLSAPASSLRVYPLPYRLKRPLLCKCSPFLP